MTIGPVNPTLITGCVTRRWPYRAESPARGTTLASGSARMPEQAPSAGQPSEPRAGTARSAQQVGHAQRPRPNMGAHRRADAADHQLTLVDVGHALEELGQFDGV